ncbi:unnamed protein product [Cylicostephanus goldi]|uniref:Uncharacterized protein n=1 Tax=Cylicostephanus goldi TaxID=71465 RepID=A0A3P6SAB4_CYLGO|nr:unnamed protein product [Cylicostephanus goldi]
MIVCLLSQPPLTGFFSEMKYCQPQHDNTPSCYKYEDNVSSNSFTYLTLQNKAEPGFCANGGLSSLFGRTSGNENVLQKPSFVVVDAGVNYEKDKKRNFGRHDKKYVLLPYHQELSQCLDGHLEHIKHGLLISAIVNENRPALRNYIHALKKFIDAHGFRFPKEDHLKFIKLMYLIMIKKDQWHDVVHYAAKALEKLIK